MHAHPRIIFKQHTYIPFYFYCIEIWNIGNLCKGKALRTIPAAGRVMIDFIWEVPTIKAQLEPRQYKTVYLIDQL